MVVSLVCQSHLIYDLRNRHSYSYLSEYHPGGHNIYNILLVRVETRVGHTLGYVHHFRSVVQD